MYGHAILKHGLTAFDALKQGIREIEFLADPSSGEVRIGCSEVISATILPPIIHRFSQAYPRVTIQVHDVPSVTGEQYRLSDQKHDLALARWVMPLPGDRLGDDLNVEILFESPLVLAAGRHTRWAHRRKIELADLVGEAWVLGPPTTANHADIAEAFQIKKLPMPKISLVTLSVPLRVYLLANGRYVTALPRPTAIQYALKVLPVDLPARPWPFAVVTLKIRTLSPVVELFIDHLRDFTQSFGAR